MTVWLDEVGLSKENLQFYKAQKLSVFSTISEKAFCGIEAPELRQQTGVWKKNWIIWKNIGSEFWTCIYIYIYYQKNKATSYKNNYPELNTYAKFKKYKFVDNECKCQILSLIFPCASPALLPIYMQNSHPCSRQRLL